VKGKKRERAGLPLRCFLEKAGSLLLLEFWTVHGGGARGFRVDRDGYNAHFWTIEEKRRQNMTILGLYSLEIGLWQVV